MVRRRVAEIHREGGSGAPRARAPRARPSRGQPAAPRQVLHRRRVLRLSPRTRRQPHQRGHRPSPLRPPRAGHEGSVQDPSPVGHLRDPGAAQLGRVESPRADARARGDDPVLPNSRGRQPGLVEPPHRRTHPRRETRRHRHRHGVRRGVPRVRRRRQARAPVQILGAPVPRHRTGAAGWRVWSRPTQRSSRRALRLASRQTQDARHHLRPLYPPQRPERRDVRGGDESEAEERAERQGGGGDGRVGLRRRAIRAGSIRRGADDVDLGGGDRDDTRAEVSTLRVGRGRARDVDQPRESERTATAGNAARARSANVVVVVSRGEGGGGRDARGGVGRRGRGGAESGGVRVRRRGANRRRGRVRRLLHR